MQEYEFSLTRVFRMRTESTFLYFLGKMRIRENPPLFWYILPVLSFLLEVHGRDNQMALKGLLKFKF